MSNSHAGTRSILYLVRGDFKGLKTWYYVLVDKLKLPLLQQSATVKSTEEVCRFGKIVSSGWGETPPDFIRLKMESLYG